MKKFIITIESEASSRQLQENGLRLVTPDMPVHRSVEMRVNIQDGQSTESAHVVYKVPNHLADELVQRMKKGIRLEVEGKRYVFNGGFYKGTILEVQRVLNWNHTMIREPEKANNVIVFPNVLDH